MVLAAWLSRLWRQQTEYFLMTTTDLVVGALGLLPFEFSSAA